MGFGNSNVFRGLIGKKKSGGLRNLILIFLVILVITSSSSYGIYRNYKEVIIKNFQIELMKKHDIVIGFLTLLDEQVNNKVITREEAQKKAVEYMSGPIMENGYRDLSKSKLGFDENLYIYAISTSGKIIMHPYYEGKELWDYRDKNDNFVIREIVNENRFGKIIEYNWKNPGGEDFLVMDYADYYKPWGWIIGFAQNKVVSLERLNNLKFIIIAIMLIMVPLATILIQLLFVSNSKRAKLEKKFYYSSYFDTLTGLPNRMLFHEKLKNKILGLKDKNKLMGIIVIDIDKFNKINDTMGPSVGDKLLREVGVRLKKLVDDNILLARHSADEFIIFMPSINSIENCTKMTESITETITKPFLISDYEIYITASMGISIYPYNGQTAETLIKNADTAMNYAKFQGRNSYMLYAPSMDDNAIEQIELENDLRKALYRDELMLHYQPLVEITTGKIIGMEALIRWNRPGHGVVSPAKFIPVAEETGMIISIGEWVLNEACIQNKKWQDMGYSRIRVAVNISPRQFEQSNFIETVKNAIKSSGLEADYLELEITEDAIKNLDKAKEILRKLKEIGVRISLDDFGTGYSSLSYLKLLPIDTLKIDKSFVTDMAYSEREVALTTAVINMGHNLKLKVLAEGVETEEQLAILKNYNCDVVQGYFYSKPLSACEFEEILINGLG